MIHILIKVYLPFPPLTEYVIFPNTPESRSVAYKAQDYLQSTESKKNTILISQPYFYM